MISAALADPGTVWMFVMMAALGSVAGVVAALAHRAGAGARRSSCGASAPSGPDARSGPTGAGASSPSPSPRCCPPPMPFKVFVLASGVFGFPYVRFALTLLLARDRPLHVLGGDGGRLR